MATNLYTDYLQTTAGLNFTTPGHGTNFLELDGSNIFRVVSDLKDPSITPIDVNYETPIVGETALDAMEDLALEIRSVDVIDDAVGSDGALALSIIAAVVGTQYDNTLEVSIALNALDEDDLQEIAEELEDNGFDVGDYIPGVFFGDFSDHDKDELVPAIIGGLNEEGALKSVQKPFIDDTQLMTDLARIFTGESYSGRESWKEFLIAIGITDLNERERLTNAFINEFSYFMGIPDDPTSNLGAWEDLVDFSSTATSDTSVLLVRSGGSDTDLTGVIGPGDTPATAIDDRVKFVEHSFRQTMDYFLANYTFPLQRPEGTEIQQFVTDFRRFLVARTGIQDAGIGQFQSLTDYRQLYDSFVGVGESDYKERLVDFHNLMVKRDGFFSPSIHLKDWVEEVQIASVFTSGAINSITGTESGRTRIFVRLFLLLVEMVEALQRVTAAQSQRLKFYAAYQKAYTELLGETPTLGLDNLERGVLDTDSQGRTATLQTVQAFVSGWSEKLRSFRSVIGDESKQHQTAVNQSNEIVNQQAQLGSSLLQQMSTILTTIFK